MKAKVLSVLGCLVGPGIALAQGSVDFKNIRPPPPPPPSNPSGYIVPIAPGGSPGAQAGGSYTTQGGTTYNGTASGTSSGQGSAGASVTIPCGKACGN